MKISGFIVIAALFVHTAAAASLAVSTYLKDGFTPTAIASDAGGNIYLAGSAVIDSASQSTGAVVAKLDPKVTKFQYLSYFDSAASDQFFAITVDSAGNAYIAGSTVNPNFPNTGSLGAASTGSADYRAFVVKLSPAGAVVFSVLIGGSTAAQASGIAVTPQGQILVSGVATASGFPHTTGAYGVADSTNHWFLMELNSTGNQTIFSAIGIGGSAIALDASGNIYLAGSSPGTDYPTTAGAYQTQFVQGNYCYGVCNFGTAGNLQHVTKVDPAASKLIYSTGLNDTTGDAGSTTNTGLAIDPQGNAYVTGMLIQAQYPFTVQVTASSAYLTKLDAAGANVLFSIPIGGAGVQVDSSGAIYAGGLVSSYNIIGIESTTPLAPPPIFSWIPQQCRPDNITAVSEAYVMKVDPSSGAVLDGQWIDGSGPAATGITLADGDVWITGATPSPDVPFTAGVLTPENLGPGFLAGGYVSAVSFAGGVNTGPALACVLDAANLTHVGAVAAYQLLSIFGSNLGPSTGVAAPGGGEKSLAGVSITFDGIPAQLLYVSSSQINVVVPAPLTTTQTLSSTMLMQLTVNGSSIQRQFPYTGSNLNLFADLSSDEISCPGALTVGGAFQPLALNADGSVNSCANPAKYGSTISLFMEGVGGDSIGFQPPQQLRNVEASVGYCSAAVTNAALVGGFVYQVALTLPASQEPCGDSVSSSAENLFNVAFTYNGAAVGPLAVPAPNGGPFIEFAPNQPLPMIVWVTN